MPPKKGGIKTLKSVVNEFKRRSHIANITRKKRPDLFKKPIYNILTRQIEENRTRLSTEILSMYDSFKANYLRNSVTAFQLQTQALRIRAAIAKRENIHTILKDEYTKYTSEQTAKGLAISAAINNTWVRFQSDYMSRDIPYAQLEVQANAIQNILRDQKEIEIQTRREEPVPELAAKLPTVNYEDYATSADAWDRAKEAKSGQIIYKTHFRQTSKLINELKNLYPNRKVLNHPGRKPIGNNADKLREYADQVNQYEGTQQRFEDFNKQYLQTAGLNDALNTLLRGAKSSFSELERKLFNIPEVKMTLRALLKSKEIVDQQKAVKGERDTLLKQLKDLNQPSKIRERIIEGGEIPVFYKIVKDPESNEDIAIPYTNEDIDMLQGADGDRQLQDEDMYIEIKRNRAITTTVNPDTNFYTYDDPDDQLPPPEIRAKKYPTAYGPLRARPRLPIVTAAQLNPGAPSRKRQRAGAWSRALLYFIANRIFTNRLRRNGNPGRVVPVKSLLTNNETIIGIDPAYFQEFMARQKDSVLNRDGSEMDAEYIRLMNSLLDPTEEDLRDPNVNEPNALANLLREGFDMTIPISMAQIKANLTWTNYSPPPRADAPPIVKFERPIDTARKVARGGDWRCLGLFYTYTKVLKVVDACHDFPQDAHAVIANAMELCVINPSVENAWIHGQLQLLLTAIGNVASQEKLEHFTLKKIDELTDGLSRFEGVGFSPFLPSNQRIIAQGNLSDVTNGVRAVDELAGYISRIDPVVAFEATDHLKVWGKDGLVRALLDQGIQIEKAATNFDKLDAASEAVPNQKYLNTCEGLPAVPPIRSRGWDVIYEGTDTNKAHLDPEAGLLYSSAVEREKLIATLGGRVGVVLNAGLPNVCEVFTRQGGQLKVEVYCQVNNVYKLICTHGATPYSVNTICKLAGLSGGRGGLLTTARGDSPITWSPYIRVLEAGQAVPDADFPAGTPQNEASRKTLVSILKTNALIDRKCSGDGRMTTMFGLGITLDVLAAYFFLLFYGISLILVKGQYKLISLHPLPSDAAMQAEKWKGLHYLRDTDGGTYVLQKALRQYNDVYTLLENVGQFDNSSYNDLEPLAFTAASAAFMKLRKNTTTTPHSRIDLAYLRTKLAGATIDTWPYSNITGWIENELQTSAATQSYSNTLKQLEECIFNIANLESLKRSAAAIPEAAAAAAPARARARAAAGAPARAAAASARGRSAAAPARARAASARGRSAAADENNNDNNDNNDEDASNEDESDNEDRPAARAKAAPRARAAAADEDNDDDRPAAAAVIQPARDMRSIQLQFFDKLLNVIIDSINITKNDDEFYIIVVKTMYRVAKHGCVWDKSNYISIQNLGSILAGLENTVETPLVLGGMPSKLQTCINQMYALWNAERPAAEGAGAGGAGAGGAGAGGAGIRAAVGSPAGGAGAAAPAIAASVAMAASAPAPALTLGAPAPAPPAGGAGAGAAAPAIAASVAMAASAPAPPTPVPSAPRSTRNIEEIRGVNRLLGLPENDGLANNKGQSPAAAEPGGGGGGSTISAINAGGAVISSPPPPSISAANASAAKASPASASPASASAVNAGGRRRHVTRRRKQKSRRR